jgi:hypothetical protein
MSRSPTHKVTPPTQPKTVKQLENNNEQHVTQLSSHESQEKFQFEDDTRIRETYYHNNSEYPVKQRQLVSVAGVLEHETHTLKTQDYIYQLPARQQQPPVAPLRTRKWNFRQQNRDPKQNAKHNRYNKRARLNVRSTKGKRRAADRQWYSHTDQYPYHPPYNQPSHLFVQTNGERVRLLTHMQPVWSYHHNS